MTIPRRAFMPPTVRRVILVVTDGLRPDIIPLLGLPTFGRLVTFPSGHAAAAASVALGYASAFPLLAVPLLCAGALVGASRVVLGVHFPADVLAGQLLALVTAAAAAPLL